MVRGKAMVLSVLLTLTLGASPVPDTDVVAPTQAREAKR